jgi:hypothetical protein
MDSSPEATIQRLLDQHAAHERETAAVQAVTERLLNRGWEAVARSRTLLLSLEAEQRRCTT